MKKVADILLQLETDEEFEAAFPILCFSFLDLKNSIIAIHKEYDSMIFPTNIVAMNEKIQSPLK